MMNSRHSRQRTQAYNMDQKRPTRPTVKRYTTRSLTRYVVFSISAMIIYTIIVLVLSCFEIQVSDVLTECVFKVFGGETFVCAVLKSLKLIGDFKSIKEQET